MTELKLYYGRDGYETIATLIPNQLISNSAWSIRGSTSSVAAVADNDSDTYVQTSNRDAVLHHGYDSLVIPPRCRLTEISVALHVGSQKDPNVPSLGRCKFLISLGVNSFAAYLNLDYNYGDSISPDVWNPESLYSLDSPQLQTDLDGLTLKTSLINMPSSGWEVYIRRLWMRLRLDRAPVVSNVRPLDYASSPNILVSWDYVDPEKDPQEYSWVKAFNLAQYSATGFDPETSPAVYSWWVKSSAQSRTIPSLPDDRYRIYVKAADINSNVRYSFWEFTEVEVRNRYIQSVV